MGNEFSSANSVWVQTEHPTYYAGDTVNGTIYLNCLNQFPCRGLFISLFGEETTHWVDIIHETRYRTGANGQQETYQHAVEHPRHGRTEFFSVKVPVYNFAGQVMPGQYCFPFQFQLPAGLPGVFEASSGQKTKASIRYTVEGECDIAGFFSDREIRHRQDLVVQQKLVQAITNAQTEAHAKVTCCCCIGKGTADLKAHLDKNAYVAGEAAQILCNISNQSEEGFGKVRVELHRSMTLRDNRGHTHRSNDVVCRQQFGGVGPGEVRDDSNPLALSLTLSGEIYPSVQGQLIHCAYYVDVVFVADSMVVGNLHVKVPITIYAPQPPPTQFIQQMPSGWNPQMMPSVNVQLPNAPAAAAPMPQAPQQYASQPQASDRTPLISNQPQGAQPQYGQQAAPQYGQNQPQQYAQQPQQRFDPMTGKPL